MAALIRGWIAASASPALQQIQREMEEALIPWMQPAIATGQQVGAVRTDLPSGLLIAVTAGMGQAMDTWLLTQTADPAELPALISTLMGMIRRALQN